MLPGSCGKSDYTGGCSSRGLSMGMLVPAGLGALAGSGLTVYLHMTQQLHSSDWIPLLVSVGAGTVVGMLTTALLSKWIHPRNHNVTDRFAGHSRLPTPLKLYHWHVYRSARVTWFIVEAGLQDEFEVVHYDPHTEPDERRQWYQANVHPNGTVPALEMADGSTLLEGVGIVLYLADIWQQLLPPTGENGQYYSWSVFAAATFDPCIRIIYYQLYATAKENRDKAVIEQASKRYDGCATALEKHLQDRDYICGQQFTAADICVGYSVMWASTIQGGVMLQDYPRIKAYLARLKKRPSFQKEMGTTREWLTSSDSPSGI